jgi:hypothetical protein
MMPPFFPATIALIVKLLVLLGLVIYAVFAAVIVRQERLMSDVLEEGFEPILRILTYIHLALAVFMIFLAFVLL